MKAKVLILILCLCVLTSLLCVTVSAADDVVKMPRLLDMADLLTDASESKLLSKLDSYTEKHQVEFAIVTIDGLDGMDAKDFADYLYDELKYGIGEERNGVMILVSVDEELGDNGRDYAVRIYGDKALDAIGDSEYESIMDEVLPLLSNGNYDSAFETFVNECESCFNFDFAKGLIISLVIGFVIAFIVTNSMKNQLKSVRFQNQAMNYVKDGSMNVTTANDFYLYRTITRVARPKNNSSGSGGRSSGGGRTYSGKF